MSDQIEIKGVREGVLVEIGPADWLESKQDLLLELKQRRDFLNGAKIILNVKSQDLGAAEMGRLRDAIEDMDLSLWAVLSESEKTRKSAQTLGLATRIHQNSSHGELGNESAQNDALGSSFVEKTVRSGSKLSFPGHVTIFGDVNPGAEIIASGHIIVWGRLRGVVHAGAEGDRKAKVCALDLSPTQLRIADQIAIPPEREEEPRPEMAFLRDGQLEAEYWMPARQVL